MEKQKRPPLPLNASSQEKYDNLILTFFEEWQEFHGQKIRVYEKLTTLRPEYYGFLNAREFAYYINALLKDELLEGSTEQFRAPQGSIVIKGEEIYTCNIASVTFGGLNYCLSLLESGKNSTRCFVALKYSDDMVPFYDKGIAKAIEDNGFRSFRVDREHAENEQTINDFIIASIKQSRFCVADLTHKSHGAYFEAGYALGRGLKVIYTCRADHFEEVHFDLKNMQIIKYATPEELREALDWKIKAVINE